jgi:hypothetical protein
MHEREQGREHAGSAPTTADDGVAPGRATRSSQLNAPGHPIVSGLIQRKAHDDNGVDANADEALSRASQTTGAALPTTIQRKFESSLGTDLSSVRVHTGETSAAAASAVSARAYTVGQDIHFAAGQYDPSSETGEQLLAHEVAHTVQQRGGTPVRQNKLEVSSPGDAAEHEADRAADAMVAGRSATVGGFTAQVSRNAITDPGPDPFDAELPPAVLAQIDQLTLDACRSMAQVSITKAYGNFADACDRVRRQLEKEKKEEEERKQWWVDLALGAVGMLASPLSAALGTAAAEALPKMRTTAIGKVQGSLPSVLKNVGVDRKTGKTLTQKTVDTLASKRLTSLLDKVTPETAAGLIDSAAEKIGKWAAKVDMNGSPQDKAASFIDALHNAADHSSTQLLFEAAACTDIPTLLGLHQRFSAGAFELYVAELETRAKHFAQQLGGTHDTSPAHRSDTVVLINAYGRERLATVFYIPSSMNFSFRSWVTPDMEPLVRQLYPNPLQITPAMVADHVPDPVREGATNTHDELVVRCDAWGRYRLVMVHPKSGEFEFAGWVTDDDEAVARAKGSLQIGGIPDVDPAHIHRLQAPDR